MNSENSVLAALIAGISTVIVGLLSLFSSSKDTGAPSKKTIYEMELNAVWEPLDQLLSYQPISDSASILTKIELIVSENYKLIPPEFIREFTRLKQVRKLKPTDFSKAQEITSSYFNWIRKNLGYPFDKEKILIEYSPTSGRDIFITIVGYGLFILTAVIISLISLFSLIMLYTNDRMSGYDALALSITMLGVVVTINLMLRQQTK